MKQFALAGLMLFCAFSAYADEVDTPPGDISSYLNPEINDFNGLSETVWQMLNDAGRTIGYQGGKAQRSYELRQALITRDDILSKTYDFRPLISRQGYLPPVIATSTDLAHITADQIRTAYRTYNIIVPARFVSNLRAGVHTFYSVFQVNASRPRMLLFAPKTAKKKLSGRKQFVRDGKKDVKVQTGRLNQILIVLLAIIPACSVTPRFCSKGLSRHLTSKKPSKV